MLLFLELSAIFFGLHKLTNPLWSRQVSRKNVCENGKIAKMVSDDFILTIPRNAVIQTKGPQLIPNHG